MNKQDKINYERDGFFILKNVIKKEECSRFLNESVVPALKKKNIDIYNKNTYKNKIGEMILGNNNTNHPINKKYKDSRWPSLYDSKKLMETLNYIHCRRNKKKWNWYYSEEGVGWIHLRYPYSRKKRWQVPNNGWHIDGDIDGKIDPNKSVTILPLVTKIRKGYGGTAIMKGSHKKINYWMHKLQNKIDLYDYINKNIDKKNCIEANGNQGDILIMHPDLVHAPSVALNKANIPVRVTFNLSVKKK